MRSDDLPRLVVHASDFAPTKEFVAAVIMQREYARQRSLGAGRLEEDRLCAWAIGELPREALHVQSIEFVRCLDSDIGPAAEIDGGDALEETLPCRRPPFVERFPLAGSKGKPCRAIAEDFFRQPRPVRPDHVWSSWLRAVLRACRPGRRKKLDECQQVSRS